MSGICGIIKFDDESVTDIEIESMLSALEYCGNDAQGVWRDTRCGLGQKILWTTKESLYENTPIFNTNETLVLTADARLDNRDELLEKLDLRKESVDKIIDSLLILKAYERWGEQCTKFLVGDFAFAVWDTVKERLFCARDRIGIRPFYYLHNDKIFIFSSEISLFHKLGYVKKTANKKAMKDYVENLSIAYEETFYEGVYQLPSSMSCYVKQDKVIKKRYWFPERIRVDKTLSYESAVKKFRYYFDQAVDACMRSTYPVGIEVSGGLDSSSVACVAVDLRSSEHLRMISLRYGELPSDEGEYIEAVHKKTGLEKITLDADTLDLKQYSLDNLYQRSQHWPAGGPILEYLALDDILQSQKIRVVLTGVGGDEIIAGSYGYLIDYAREKSFAKVFRTLMCAGFDRDIIDLLLYRTSRIYRWVKNAISFFYNQPEEYALSKLKPSTEEVKNERLWEFVYNKTLFYSEDSRANIHELLSTDQSMWVNSTLSRTSGGHNIEYRHPFFDTRLIEFVLSLPPEFKLKCKERKKILRSAMKFTLPEKIRRRRDDPSFNTSVTQQAREFYEILKNKNISLVKDGYISQNKLELLMQRYKENTLEDMEGVVLWQLINFEYWYKRNFKL